MKLNCIIIDDEPLARKGLKEYIADVDFLTLLGDFESPLKAASLLSEEQIHLLFLDIQMPKINGLEFFKTLKNAPPVIFTTAYSQHALDGFELNALDYLVKPISFERFLKGVLKAKEYYELRVKSPELKSGDDHFFIKSDHRLIKIFFEEILFIEALQNYVNIQTKDKKYLTYLTFHAIEEYLPQHQFVKTHKSYIIAVDKVDGIDNNIILIKNHTIPISRNLKEEVMEKLLGNRFLKR